MDTLTPADVSQEDLPDWGIYDEDALALRTIAQTGSFTAGLDLVNGIGELAEDAGHHPDIELTYPRVVITLTTHDAGGITRADIDLAKEISALARALEVTLVSNS